MSEDEKIARARQQLIMTGVICVTVVVFVLWLINLPRTFARHRKEYVSPVQVFKEQLERHNLWNK